MNVSAASLEIAARLCARAGRASPLHLERVAGGKNNRVYCVTLSDGETTVLKTYHSDPRDPRDRLAAEWSFLAYVWQRGLRCVPEPLADEPQSHSALYTFVRGHKLAAQAVKGIHVKQAAEFMLAANAKPRAPEGLKPASEACFSYADHMRTIDRRVARLSNLDPSAPGVERAKELVEAALIPAWKRVREQISVESDVCSELPLAEQCVSPSDFGFHNALVDEADHVSFIDFEYAGRDDPAKLVCDFFCCPEIPVPLEFRSGFVADLSTGLGLSPSFTRRCDTLIDAYRIKWTCIILNEFLPVEAARRDFAETGPRAARCAAQLEKALAKIGEIGST